MAQVAIKGKTTVFGRDLMKDPYKVEELKNYEQSLVRFANTSLTLEEYELNYKPSPAVSKFMARQYSEPKDLDELMNMLNMGLISGIGSSMELLAQKGYKASGLAGIQWESKTLQRVWSILFNAEKKNNISINGVARYVWIEEIHRRVFTTNELVSTQELKTLIEEMRGIKDILTKENIMKDILDTVSMLIVLVEQFLREILLGEIKKVADRLVCKPGFWSKFWNTICEYKWYIIGYTVGIAIVYFGLAAFAIPVAGEVWSVGTAAAATATEVAAVTASVGVAGAILL